MVSICAFIHPPNHSLSYFPLTPSLPHSIHSIHFLIRYNSISLKCCLNVDGAHPIQIQSSVKSHLSAITEILLMLFGWRSNSLLINRDHSKGSLSFPARVISLTDPEVSGATRPCLGAAFLLRRLLV